ncbi:hypothetical protein PoB_006139400 [Plakobranchus ocellatus]|uniref:Uncharacterized protein n=1 Tax=Plakobranchus ocellatus TaxID=259542 RepID=A0AAV4CSQ7_9GAST|nr:hypothetical protein PoB_006139400 [Plakobranchus ocellatus]
MLRIVFDFNHNWKYKDKARLGQMRQDHLCQGKPQGARHSIHRDRVEGVVSKLLHSTSLEMKDIAAENLGKEFSISRAGSLTVEPWRDSGADGRRSFYTQQLKEEEDEEKEWDEEEMEKKRVDTAQQSSHNESSTLLNHVSNRILMLQGGRDAFLGHTEGESIGRLRVSILVILRSERWAHYWGLQKIDWVEERMRERSKIHTELRPLDGSERNEYVPGYSGCYKQQREGQGRERKGREVEELVSRNMAA